MFHDISTRYWASDKGCNAALDTLSNQIFLSWDGVVGMEGDNEEDSPEYCEQVYKQLKEDTKAML